MNFTEGATILIDKPAGWTSFDVVKKIRNAIGAYQKKNAPDEAGLKRPKVGHAGTLDPLASGLLILCTGRMTKMIAGIQQQEKEYTGTFFLGAETLSYDMETEPGRFSETAHITEAAIREQAFRMTGRIMQVPPAHSAVMADGRRAYARARKGQPVELKARPVEIREFEIVRVAMPVVAFRVVCGKGTYIRSLAHDFGKALGSGAYLQSLCRTRIGNYRLEQALQPDPWCAMLAARESAS